MSELIAATESFRAKVAYAVAHSSIAPMITHVAWGSGTSPSSHDDTVLQAEVVRTPVGSQAPSGVTLSINAEVDGDLTQGAALTEVGLIDSDGDLAGRRVFSPLQLDPGTRLKTTFNLIF